MAYTQNEHTALVLSTSFLSFCADDGTLFVSSLRNSILENSNLNERDEVEWHGMQERRRGALYCIV